MTTLWPTAFALLVLLAPPVVIGAYQLGVRAGRLQEEAKSRWSSVCNLCGWQSGEYAARQPAEAVLARHQKRDCIGGGIDRLTNLPRLRMVSPAEQDAVRSRRLARAR